MKHSRNSHAIWKIAMAATLAAAFTSLSACSSNDDEAPSTTATEPAATQPCADRVLNVGFYAFFDPVSYSAVEDSDSPEFDTHLGYEADLLTALESMQGAGLSFSRSPIAAWNDIWLGSSTDEYDIMGGGITILDSRTRDANGNLSIAFTSGHIEFRQSILTRAEDAERLATYADLTSDVRIGVLRGTTGEARLLEITGLVDSNGALAAGARIETEDGLVTTDGSADYTITAAIESESIMTRRRLIPPSASMPEVVYLGEELGESELLDALKNGDIDGLARGEVGNREAARDGTLAVTAVDESFENGGFTVDADDADLLACLDDKIDYLTDNRRIGYPVWVADPSVFMRRAQAWKNGEQ